MPQNDAATAFIHFYLNNDSRKEMFNSPYYMHDWHLHCFRNTRILGPIVLHAEDRRNQSQTSTLAKVWKSSLKCNPAR